MRRESEAKKIKTETEQTLYLLREECTVGTEEDRQTISIDKQHLSQSVRALASLHSKRAVDVTFAFKIVNLLLEGQ